MAKWLDRVFLHYGVRQEDMEIIEQSCRDCDIDAEWLKEYVLMPCNKEREAIEDERKLNKILNKALNNLPT